MKTQTTHSRRRAVGAALQNALLDAAWDELVAHGYSAFTIEAVATRAHASRAVLYRRWPTKPELARAAVVHSAQKGIVTIPDTGSLRDDVVALLRSTSRARAQLAVPVAVQLAGYFAETGRSISELRSVFLAGRANAMQVVLARAVARREVDPARLTPRIVRVPFDLSRAEVLRDTESSARRRHHLHRRRGLHACGAGVTAGCAVWRAAPTCSPARTGWPGKQRPPGRPAS